MNRPFGNDFIVATPSLDQLGQRLYSEEMQRQAQNRANIKSLDDEFSKNVSGIRDADVEDLTKLYQDYKMSTQEQMRRKGGISPKDQMDLLRKKAAMYKLINESKSEKEREELDTKRYAMKPDDFNEDASKLMIEGRKLPLSKKREYSYTDASGKQIVLDLTNSENFRWQDKTNWQPILQKAGGTLAQRGQQVIVDLPGGLEQEITTYKGGNDPVEFYQSIIGAMNTPRASQSLATRYNFTPEEAQDIMLKFEELKKTPAFKNAYGDVKFPESAGISQGGKTAMLLAMTNAINNPPIETKTTRRNLDAITKDRQQFQKEQQARSHAASFSRLIYAIKNRQLPWMNATDVASYIIGTDNGYGANQPVQYDVGKYETITGGKKPSSNSELRTDGNGGYIYGIKDGNGDFVEQGRVDAVTAQDRLTKEAAKNPAANPAIRVPKNIKNTKMQTNKKPSWAN